eukprot:TRINITY_DN5195_c0_g1_i1.p1 TRINITY_DN5195_c0_g1~~TRINITY_DN5195_c0_g1_i1.p1  ORF type:complete len:434 (-),score=50.41 TRINITY_DN5195_c0_g1_i1:664-1932(-)
MAEALFTDDDPLKAKQPRNNKSKAICLIGGIAGTVVIVLFLATVIIIPIIVVSSRDTPDARPPSDLIEHAKMLQRNHPLVDCHNDLPWQYLDFVNNNMTAMNISVLQSGNFPELRTDIPRLREGLVGGQFWSVYLSCSYQGTRAVQQQLAQIDIVRRLPQFYPDTFELAMTANDIQQIFKQGRIGSLMGMEGGHAINNTLSNLRMFYDLGVRYMTLTHNCNTDWADCHSGPYIHGGLTDFGKAVVMEMNRIGMLVDLSHTSADTMADALDIVRAPVVFSHSGARTVSNVTRNVPDHILDRIPANGGVVMVVFYGPFVNASDSTNVTLEMVVNHVDYIVNRIGIDHVGIGSDFDGTGRDRIKDLEDVSDYPLLVAEMLRRGYSDEDVVKFIGGNILRVLAQAEVVAAQMKNEGVLPSEALCCQ